MRLFLSSGLSHHLGSPKWSSSSSPAVRHLPFQSHDYRASLSSVFLFFLFTEGLHCLHSNMFQRSSSNMPRPLRMFFCHFHDIFATRRIHPVLYCLSASTKASISTSLFNLHLISSPRLWPIFPHHRSSMS